MADNNFEQQNKSVEVQAAVTAALNEEKKKKKKKKLIIFGVIAVIIIIIIAIASSGGNSDSNSNSNSSSTTSSVKADEKTGNNTTIGDFNVVVKKAEISKDWTGKDAVVISYDCTNNSNDSYSFDGALDEKVFQDGIELEVATMSDEDDGTWLDTSEIKPGITKEVKKAYKLRNKTSDLEIEISESFSFSDDKITSTVKLK